MSKVSAAKKPAAQVAYAEKAYAQKAAVDRTKVAPIHESNKTESAPSAEIAPQHEHDGQQVHGPRAPPTDQLLTKQRVLEIVGLTYPTIWAIMLRGEFPRSRAVGGRSMWLMSEVTEWLRSLPLRKLKGD